MKYFLFALFLPLFMEAQILSPNECFAPLIGKTWYAEGTWGDGSAFKQEIQFKPSLEHQIIIAESKGFIDKEQSMLGHRNHGIRRINAETGQLEFYEYDVFGGLTQGQVHCDAGNITYTYDYGGTMVTDAWIFQSENKYQFIVGTMQDGQWKQKFLETEFRAKSDMPNLIKRLVGSWQATAWDGVLIETWEHDPIQGLIQKALYVEEGDTLYAAQSKITQLGENWVLVSVIENSPPKVFQADQWDSESVQFQNSEYRNPSKVTYRFENGQKDRWERTIEGIEDDQPVTYTFSFQRIH